MVLMRNTPLQDANEPSFQMTGHYKNQRYSGLAGPSIIRIVGTSPALSLTPCFTSRLLLSMIIQVPRSSVKARPTAPKAAVVASAGMYFGASLLRKILLLTTPIRLATGTPTEVSITRRFSLAMLLLYHTSRITDGAEVPQVIMKVAKYATWSWFSTSIEA